MLLHLSFLSLILFFFWQSQAAPLHDGVQSLDQPVNGWPQTPFQYRDRASPPYVLYFDILGDDVESTYHLEARRAVERFTRTFASLKFVTKKLTIRSNNIALTFDPFADAVNANDVRHCAGQFESAQIRYGARAAFAYCHRANMVFGTMRLVQRANDATDWPSPWPSLPFLDKSLLHNQKLLFVTDGPFVSAAQAKQFIVLLHDAETRTQTAARSPSASKEHNHHVSAMSPNYQLDFMWSGRRSGDDLLYAFYAFVDAQYLHGQRCVDAFWQDENNRHIGKFSITKHGSPSLLGMMLTNGTEAPALVAKQALGKSSPPQSTERS